MCNTMLVIACSLYGWQHGVLHMVTILIRQPQGMAAPLVAQKRDGRHGIITHSNTDQKPKVGAERSHD